MKILIKNLLIRKVIGMVGIGCYFNKDKKSVIILLTQEGKNEGKNCNNFYIC